MLSTISKKVVVEYVGVLEAHLEPTSVLITTTGLEKYGVSSAPIAIDMSLVDTETLSCLKELLCILKDPSRVYMLTK